MALLRVITEKEVEETVKTMAKNKAPRPDRYTSEFFQATWSFMRQDIVNAVEESRWMKRMHPAWNATFFALISKTKKAEEPQGFRPIALCNTGFVKGRQIVDGIIVAQEAIHSLQNSRHKGMMIKLDLAKAYDRLSWEYLQKILKAYGFDDR
eukprot:PITA_07285